ncbi:MAG TPA: PQQ-binding-like beta-propeller repeat protein [Streptosporangiaceae bacterium]|nr:PQQ-binding-like beta-propeller repeat protein [Streptosporangiaceae bacterium]
MSNKASTVGARRPAMTGAALVVAAALIAGGCSSSSSSKSSTSTLACPSKRGAAVTGTAPPATGRPAAGWTQPDADLASTRYVTSAITSANVSKLGVAWTVPLTMNTTHTDGAYAATPVIVNGVVYIQDLDSDVFAISLATGKVLWTHDYNSPNGGPDGVNVTGGVVYAATAKAAVALDAATGAQLWSRTLIANDHEGIAMAPGFDNGTVYVSTVPANVTTVYGAGGQGILWALNAKTGAPEWSWNQDQNLWGNPGVNSGAGLWYTPSFDAQGDIYLGIANPAPIFGTKSYPLGSSRPGPDLYTDSVVKLSPAGKLLWYYQLTPHDLYDWDLQNPPVLTTANGRPVVIAGGKAGIMIELDAQTGQLLWQRPVGGHSGHENDGLLTEHASPTSHDPLPAKYCLEPSLYGGMLTQLASNGSTTFAAVNDFALAASPTGFTGSVTSQVQAFYKAVGEMVAVNQDTGAVIWDTPLPSSPFGAATVTNDVVFTTTFTGYLYALDATNGAILFKTPMSAASNAPVAVDGDYVIAGAGEAMSSTQRNMIIAYKLGATGKLPDTVGA